MFFYMYIFYSHVPYSLVLTIKWQVIENYLEGPIQKVRLATPAKHLKVSQSPEEKVDHRAQWRYYKNTLGLVVYRQRYMTQHS